MRKPVVFREQGGTHAPLACRHLSGCAQTQSQSPARPVAGDVPAGGWARPPPAAPCMPSCGAPPLSPLPPLAHTPMESCSAFPSSRSPAAARSWGLCPGARGEGALGEAGRRAGWRWPLGLAASSGGKPKKKKGGRGANPSSTTAPLATAASPLIHLTPHPPPSLLSRRLLQLWRRQPHAPAPGPPDALARRKLRPAQDAQGKKNNGREGGGGCGERGAAARACLVGGRGACPPLFFFFSFSPAPPHTFSLLLSCL